MATCFLEQAHRFPGSYRSAMGLLPMIQNLDSNKLSNVQHAHELGHGVLRKEIACSPGRQPARQTFVGRWHVTLVVGRILLAWTGIRSPLGLPALEIHANCKSVLPCLAIRVNSFHTDD